MLSQKIALNILLYLVICIKVVAQYSQPIEIYDVGSDFLPSTLLVDDFNGDTKSDIICSDFISKEFALLKNIGTSQLELNHNLVDDSTLTWNQFDLAYWSKADINNDGFTDLFYTYDFFFWLENDGTGKFTKGADLNFDGITTLYSIIDLNNDGAIDFAYLNLARELNYVQNKGDGTFEDPIILSSNVPFFSNARGFEFGDINKDGHLDLILNNFDSLQIHYNNGINIFLFEEIIPISTTIYGLEFSDFDSDNDLDIIARVNSGENIFVNNPDGWVEDTLLKRVDYQYQLDKQIVDLDANGQNDIVKLQVYLDEDSKEFTKVVWYKNYDNGSFIDTVILVDTSNIRAFRLDDFDDDELLDLAYTTLVTNGIDVFDGNIGWINNNDLVGSSPNSDGDNLQFETEDFKILSRNVAFSNVDEDPQTEFMISNVTKTSKQELTLFNGQPINEFFTDTILLESPYSLLEMHLDDLSKVLIGDVNGDNIQDVIQKTGPLEYVVFQPTEINNLGEPIYVNIDPTAIRDFKFYGLKDRENDGDLDIYSSFKFDNGWKLVWLINNGTGVFDDFSYIENIAYNYENGYKDIILADIDGDLDEDIIAYSNEAVVWYLNLGNGNNGPANLVAISEEIDQLNMEVVDLNGDGDNELLVYVAYVACVSHFCFYNKEFYVFDFKNSTQSFELLAFNNSWPLEIYGGLLNIDGFTSYGSDVNFQLIYRDFNADGNLDILTIDPDNGTLIALLGDGLGNFIDQQTILSSDEFIISSDIVLGANRVGLYETDIEGDGDLDLIFIKSTNHNGGIYLIENLEINLAIDLDQDGIALFYDCDDNDSLVLDSIALPIIETSLQNCVGDQLEFEITNTTSNVSYLWFTPTDPIDIPNFIIDSVGLADAGVYSVQSFLGSCESEVAIANIEVAEYPNIVIQVSDDSLILSGLNPSDIVFQWFFDGDEIENANENYIIPSESGSYHVVVTNVNDCSAASEELQHIVNEIAENTIQGIDLFPNPIKNGAYLNIDIKELFYADYIIKNVNGQELEKGELGKSKTIFIDNLPVGLYILELYNSDQKKVDFFIIAE